MHRVGDTTTELNMASHSGGFQPLCGNEEMASDFGQPKDLSEFLKTAVLPICVCVTSGKHLTKSVQITKGDLIFLKSSETKTVTLTHQDSGGTRKQVNVPLDFPYNFSVLPPKNVSDRSASVFMYPCISDLILDSPTYFEATTPYDDPYLPGFSIHRGDRFKFRGLVTDPKDGRERLKVFDELDNLLLLSLDCRANFFPLEDEESYTLRQLIDFAPVPRRLRISKRDSITSGDSGFKDYVGVNDDEKNSSLERKSDSSYDHDISELINYTGVIHMLKPNLSIIASPLNDTNTLWKIPLTADICVREHNLDDYEVPSIVKSVAKNQHSSFSTSTSSSPPPTPQTPTFPAPPTPPLPQPLVPVDVFNFSNIYGCPVKAKIMDLSKCGAFLQNLLSASEDLSIYRLVKTKRLYAEDVKTGKFYSLAEDLHVSFIEYPEKFSIVSELLSLPIGSEITVLEDIATDFPRPFFLQFGDILRITTNTSSSIKVKHTSIDCKIIKCEKVNREGGSNQKMKLPLDFEVKMVLSTDPNNRRVIGLEEIISGMENIPSQEVATLIDNSEKTLQDLPINLKLLKVLPEKLLLASPISKNHEKSHSPEFKTETRDWPSPSDQVVGDKSVGISLTSGLVLAFRERLNPYEVDVFNPEPGVIQLPFEILTRSQFEERERMCKVWGDEEESEVQSVASDDRSSSIDASSISGQGNAGSSRKTEKRQKQKKMDKIRRLSQVLNPKHWRPPKAVPEPLPHPSAMGLMALSMRPPSDHTNDYQIKGSEDEITHSGISTDDEANVYEDVEVGPLRSGTGTPPPSRKDHKGFSGPLHKSMPSKQIMSRTNAKNRVNKRGKTPATQLSLSSIEKSSTFSIGERELIDEASGDPFYDQPGDEIDEKQEQHHKNNHTGLGYDTPRNNLLKRIPTSAMASRQNASLPPLPPRRSSSSLGPDSSNSSTTSKHNSLDSLLDQSKSSITSDMSNKREECQNHKKSLLDPPIPPRRKKNSKSSKKDTDSENTSSDSTVYSLPGRKPESSKLTNAEKLKINKAIEDKNPKGEVVENLNPEGKVIDDKNPIAKDIVDKKCDNEVIEENLRSKSETDSEKKSTCPKMNPQSEQRNQPKMPVPKPRGLRKAKTPDLLSKTDSSVHRESLDPKKKETLIGKNENVDRQLIQGDMFVTKKTEAGTSQEGIRVGTTILTKPKPPPKPKPRPK